MSHQVKLAEKRHGIYVASKCRHAEKWKALRAAGWPIISSWLDEAEPGQTSSFTDLWARNIREAAGAAAVLFYVEPGETMKGSLVEIGAAMAHGVPVYGVGTPEGCTFKEHPAFFQTSGLANALESLRWIFAEREAAMEEERTAIERMVECSIGFAETEDNGLVPLKYADWLSRAELLTAIRARRETKVTRG